MSLFKAIKQHSDNFEACFFLFCGVYAVLTRIEWIDTQSVWNYSLYILVKKWRKKQWSFFVNYDGNFSAYWNTERSLFVNTWCRFDIHTLLATLYIISSYSFNWCRPRLYFFWAFSDQRPGFPEKINHYDLDLTNPIPEIKVNHLKKA